MQLSKLCLFNNEYINVYIVELKRLNGYFYTPEFMCKNSVNISLLADGTQPYLKDGVRNKLTV